MLHLPPAKTIGTKLLVLIRVTFVVSLLILIPIFAASGSDFFQHVSFVSSTIEDTSLVRILTSSNKTLQHWENGTQTGR